MSEEKLIYSDADDEEGVSNLLVYKGDMSPEDFEEMQEQAEQGHKYTYGTCGYCGQLIDIRCKVSFQHEADTIATNTCNCTEASSERKIRQKINDGQEKVRQLFGEEADQLSFEPIAERASIELLFRIVELTARRFISSTTVQIRGYCKAKISYTTKGKIKVERSESRSYQLEDSY